MPPFWSVTDALFSISKRLDFRAYGIDIKFEEEALLKIAEMAALEKTGARGLVSAIEKVLIPFEKKLPSTGIKKMLVTPEVVESPEAQLDMRLRNPLDQAFLERFERARRKELESIGNYISTRAEDFLNKSANCLAEVVPEYADMEGVVRVIRVPDVADGQHLQVIMDAETDRALAYLAPPS